MAYSYRTLATLYSHAHQTKCYNGIQDLELPEYNTRWLYRDVYHDFYQGLGHGTYIR